MKANFALKLSFKGIRLLHRAAGGWRFVGEVTLNDPDLSGALAALRRTALELEPSGLRTKLVLPDTQIRYLTIDTADMPEDEIRSAAARALDGATPYKVRDLIFDISPDGAQTHVAAVARETLQEAEAFAVEHRFGPISFVALPDNDAFLGEPFFGVTNHAAHILGPDQNVEPDGIAVVELESVEWPDGPVLDVVEETPIAADEPKEMTGEMSRVSAQEHRDGAEKDDGSEKDPATDPDESVEAPPVQFAPAPDSVGFASRRKSGHDAAPRLGGVTRRFDPVSPPEGRAGDGTALSANRPGLAAEDTVPPTEPEPFVEDDVPDPPSSVIAAFMSRRHAKTPVHDPREDGGKPAKPSTGPDDKPGEPPASEAHPDRDRPKEAAQLAAAALTADRTPPELKPLRVPPPQTERERMTVFGARQSDTGGVAVVGGKPRFLGLALTGVLIVFLVGLAAWAAVFVDDGIARFFTPRTIEAPLSADESDSAAGLADAPAPEFLSEAEEDLQTASLEADLPQEDAASTEPEALTEPQMPEPFDAAEAAAQYAVTGIWTIPPDAPQAPALMDVDDLYVTSIDPPSDSFDAVALQPESEFARDAAPLPLADPAPPGTEFSLDERGLVIPTQDGAMTPDGIMVFSGPPPVVPPETPDRAEPVDETDAALSEELLQMRPRSRPTDLVENTERRQLGGVSRSELAEYRPKVRPESVKQAKEEDETPTDQAIASSLRPSDRPGNFSRIVARAQERQAASPREAEPQQVAAVAPRAVSPSIPSRSSVTKEATVRNAINMRRINLMGVYGSPSNRRALIRLSNGRYKKVKVGDRIDGGRVSAIGDSELSYVKGNRSIVLTMPRT